MVALLPSAACACACVRAVYCLRGCAEGGCIIYMIYSYISHFLAQNEKEGGEREEGGRKGGKEKERKTRGNR